MIRHTVVFTLKLAENSAEDKGLSCGCACVDENA